ncbi:uncharacterized protein LOC124788802 [Schistocerca piceifrons]|uniref:uncharacterized protein LOC124788802 n=1 Tax=Schistocerca piceifrons TaxID=274613 RepID=UPI001F5FB929|nr:uncharacterized protein LOC124788802 [Schistocerca piceifrons]
MEAAAAGVGVDVVADAAVEAALREALAALGEDAGAAASLRGRLQAAHRGTGSTGARLSTPRGRRLYVKVPAPEGQRVSAFSSAELFHNEAQVYRLALPAFARLGVFTAAPRCLAADGAAIVLEDLSARGFAVPCRYRGLGLDQLRLLVHQLGRFQAASLAVRTLDPATYSLMQQNIREVIYTDKFLQLYAPVLEFAARDAVQMVRKAYQNNGVYLQKLLEFAPSVVERMKSFITQSTGDFVVLTHGDIWASNLLFRYSCSSNGVQVPEEVCIVDYQTCRWAPMGLDVAYALLTTPSRQLSAGEWSELVGEWERGLQAGLAPLGLSALAPARPALDALLAAAAPYVLGAGLLNVVLTLDEGGGGGGGGGADRQPADEGDALAEFVRGLQAPFTRKTPNCQQRVLDLIVNVIDKGFL